VFLSHELVRWRSRLHYVTHVFDMMARRNARAAISPLWRAFEPALTHYAIFPYISFH